MSTAEVLRRGPGNRRKSWSPLQCLLTVLLSAGIAAGLVAAAGAQEEATNPMMEIDWP